MPVTKDELSRYRRLLELARAQKDAILAGQFGRLEEIVAERQALLKLSRPGDTVASPDGKGGETDEDGEAGEARRLLRAILEIDRQCRLLVAERLQHLEGDLGRTRAALQVNRAYRGSVEAGRPTSLFDERK